jgi:hypothetical protein
MCGSGCRRAIWRWFVIDAVAAMVCHASAAYRQDGHGWPASEPAMMVALSLRLVRERRPGWGAAASVRVGQVDALGELAAPERAGRLVGGGDERLVIGGRRQRRASRSAAASSQADGLGSFDSLRASPRVGSLVDPWWTLEGVDQAHGADSTHPVFSRWPLARPHLEARPLRRPGDRRPEAVRHLPQLTRGLGPARLAATTDVSIALVATGKYGYRPTGDVLSLIRAT